MNKILFTFSFLILFIKPLKACECNSLDWANWSPEVVERNIEQSDIIFIGELLSVDSAEYCFRVTDVFKGSIAKNEIFTGLYYSSCSGNPNKKRKGLWIFYGNYHSESDENIDGYDFSTCSLTRSIYYPIIYTPEEHINNWHSELKILNQSFKTNVHAEIQIREN